MGPGKKQFLEQSLFGTHLADVKPFGTAPVPFSLAHASIPNVGVDLLFGFEVTPGNRAGVAHVLVTVELGRQVGGGDVREGKKQGSNRSFPE